MQRGGSRVTGNGFYQTQKNFDLIYLFCVAEGKPGNLRWCETNKEKRNGGTLPVWRPDSGSIFTFLSALLVWLLKDAVGDNQWLLISIPAASA